MVTKRNKVISLRFICKQQFSPIRVILERYPLGVVIFLFLRLNELSIIALNAKLIPILAGKIKTQKKSREWRKGASSSFPLIFTLHISTHHFWSIIKVQECLFSHCINFVRIVLNKLHKRITGRVRNHTKGRKIDKYLPPQFHKRRLYDKYPSIEVKGRRHRRTKRSAFEQLVLWGWEQSGYPGFFAWQITSCSSIPRCRSPEYPRLKRQFFDIRFAAKIEVSTQSTMQSKQYLRHKGNFLKWELHLTVKTNLNLDSALA